MRGIIGLMVILSLLLIMSISAETADEVHLKHRGKVSGTIVASTDEGVEIETRAGRFWISQADIATIKRQETGLGGKAAADPESEAQPPAFFSGPGPDYVSAAYGFSVYLPKEWLIEDKGQFGRCHFKHQDKKWSLDLVVLLRQPRLNFSDYVKQRLSLLRHPQDAAEDLTGQFVNPQLYRCQKKMSRQVLYHAYFNLSHHRVLELALQCPVEDLSQAKAMFIKISDSLALEPQS